MSEQQTAAEVQETRTSACPHPGVVGKRWGDAISVERQVELQGYLDRWAAVTDHGERRGPFDRGGSGDEERRPYLTGADVFWLAEQSGRLEYGGVPNLHLERANLRGAHLEGATLAAAYLLETNLFGAHLAGADLSNAQLERADLSLAQLQGANLTGAKIWGADLRVAWFDGNTVLNGASLDVRTRLGDIQWGGIGAVNLTLIRWGGIALLGDETLMDERGHDVHGTLLHEDVVRAYRQLAAQLRPQGLGEVADHFLYRAQILQRQVLRGRGRGGAAFGSWLLDLISGYGYRPTRSFITYIVVILAFAAAYFGLGGANGQSLSWNEAIVISMTAFHGRGFFSAVFQPGDLQAAVAAVEAFIGLLIEIVFIATFTQRFFAR